MSKATEQKAAGQPPRKNNLTFGVELEFLAYTPEGLVPHDTIMEAMTSRVQIPCSKPGCSASHSWLLPFKPFNDYNVGYDGWSVTGDMSVAHDPATEGVHMLHSEMGNMEFVSRVLNFDKPTPCPHGQTYPCTGESLEWLWQDELDIILKTLHARFSQPGYRVLVNASTGVRVHIGHDSFGLPINVVKGLMGTFLALEQVFDKIAPTNRISGYDGDLAIPAMNTQSQGDPQDWVHGRYCRSTSHTMFNHLHDVIFREDYSTTTVPEVPHTEVVGDWDTHGPEVPHTEVVGEWDTPLPTEPATTTWETAFTAGSDAEEAIGWGDEETTAKTEAVPPPSPPPPTEANLQASANIRKHLRRFNIPSWLQIIFDRKTVAEIREIWSQSTDRYSVFNLTNLYEPLHGQANVTPGKHTAEIRSHAGSLDTREITAWIDFLGTLTHFLDSHPDIHHFLDIVWANPRFTFLHLLTRIGASQSTVAHYTAALAPEYAQLRYHNQLSVARNPPDELYNLTCAVEANRLMVSERAAIDAVILSKLTSGRYGQYPLPFVRARIPNFDPSGFLDIDNYDYEKWVAHVEKIWRDTHNGAYLLVESFPASRAALIRVLSEYESPAEYALRKLLEKGQSSRRSSAHL